MDIVIFEEDNGKKPLIEWLDGLNEKVKLKCLVRIDRLAEVGHHIRRPEADFLRDGIYELRISHSGVNYRILYFYHENTAILSHGITKEKEVPDREINLALKRKELYISEQLIIKKKERKSWSERGKNE